MHLQVKHKQSFLNSERIANDYSPAIANRRQSLLAKVSYCISGFRGILLMLLFEVEVPASFEKPTSWPHSTRVAQTPSSKGLALEENEGLKAL